MGAGELVRRRSVGNTRPHRWQLEFPGDDAIMPLTRALPSNEQDSSVKVATHQRNWNLSRIC